MAAKRATRFPAPGEKGTPKAPKDGENTARSAQHRGELSPILEEYELTIETKKKVKADHILPPFRVNPSSPAPSKPPPPRKESPWNEYTILHDPIDRGGEVVAAYKQTVPVQMVTIKKLASGFVKNELSSSYHKNLLAILELYQYDGIHYVITDYTIASLINIIAVPFPLQEHHISATCWQGSPSSYLTICLIDTS
jgi:hypothetical protein